MKKESLVILALLLILTACTGNVAPIQQTNTNAQSPSVISNSSQAPVILNNIEPRFKITRYFGIRHPASINGTVENIGNGTGSVKITARTYYAGVVSTERSQEIDNLEALHFANFSISIDDTVQWDSFKVTPEVIK